MNSRNVLLAGVVGMGVVIALIFAMGKPARSQEAPTAAPAYSCPPNTKCKIVVLTEDEEKTLSAPEMIFDHAAWANRAKLDALIGAWREKLKQAPQGKVAEPDKKP